MYRGRKTLLFLAALGLVLLASCQTIGIQLIQGSGNMVSEDRPVSGFTAVVVDIAADLAITPSEGDSLTITADDNLLTYITSEVKDGTLTIGTRDNALVTSGKTITLALGFINLDTITINGISHITGDNLNLNALSITFNGTGSVELSGSVGTQALTVNGTATINNFEFASQTTTINIAGSATMQVAASEALDISIAGQGNITYAGEPRVTQRIIGAGEVARAS